MSPLMPWILLASLTVACMAEFPYPGIAPGPATVQVDQEIIVLSNKVISARWRVSKQGLKPLALRDEQTQSGLTLTGELFQINVVGGQRYAASSLSPEGSPVVSDWQTNARSARWADRIPGRKVELNLRSEDSRIRVIWRAVLHQDANYIRQEIEITTAQPGCMIQAIDWLDETLTGAATAGRVDGSPIVAGNWFLGAEDPMAINQVLSAGLEQNPDKALRNQGRVRCHLERNTHLKPGETLQQSFVVGVVPAGQTRRGFLYYLERERAHPYRPFLHYNSWYDIAWSPFALNETNCLEAIQLIGERFIKAHGIVMDAMVFDDGWDDPRTLWQFHRGFPNGFAPHARMCQQYGTHLGVWLSPFGGYGEPKAQRLKFGSEQGYETNLTGFSLAGPKYYRAFKGACVDMIQKYGVNHFKFDGIASGMYANGSGADYLLDTEAMRRLMLELRQEDPDLYINLTTGSWPSPFWLRYADSVWRQGGDMGFSGKGNKQQQWLTYRDQEVFRNIVGKGPLYPLNALMTQGVAYSRHGDAGNPEFNSAGFKDDVRAFFGSGTSLQELYIQPTRLTSEDWRVLAEAAKWSRAQADVLVDTHWIGGDPSKLEVYGYASWTPRQGILMLRNPDSQLHEFSLEAGAVFELPGNAPRRYRLTSPWREDAGKPGLVMQAGRSMVLTLAPFEVLVFDAVPEREP
jgi:hypothetical protein